MSELIKSENGTVYTAGRNLLLNSGEIVFDKSDYNNSISGVTTKKITITTNEKSDLNAFFSTINNAIKLVVPVEDLYKFSGALTLTLDVKTTGLVSNTHELSFDIRESNHTGRIRSNVIILNPALNGTWQTYKMTINQLEPRAIFLFMWGARSDRSNADTGATIEFRNPMLTLGSDAYPYAPAPEDEEGTNMSTLARNSITVHVPVNNLTSTSTTDCLSAAQGKILLDKINSLQNEVNSLKGGNS